MGVCKIKDACITHDLFKIGEQGDIGTGKTINRLPVITDSEEFGITAFGEFFSEVESLEGDVLILIDEDVIEGELFTALYLLIENVSGIVDHVFKINGSFFIQCVLIFQITLSCNIQEKKCSLIIVDVGDRLEIRKAFEMIVIGFESIDEVTDQLNQFDEISVFSCLGKFSIYLFVIDLSADETMLCQFLS